MNQYIFIRSSFFTDHNTTKLLMFRNEHLRKNHYHANLINVTKQTSILEPQRNITDSDKMIYRGDLFVGKQKLDKNRAKIELSAIVGSSCSTKRTFYIERLVSRIKFALQTQFTKREATRIVTQKSFDTKLDNGVNFGTCLM